MGRQRRRGHKDLGWSKIPSWKCRRHGVVRLLGGRVGRQLSQLVVGGFVAERPERQRNERPTTDSEDHSRMPGHPPADPL